MNIQSLHQATAANDCRALKRLIKSGADVDTPNEEGNTPLQVAMLEGSFEAASLLLAAGADPNVEDEFCMQPLHHQCHSLRFIDLLLAHGAYPDPYCCNGNTPLLRAAAYGDTDCVGRLLDAGADTHQVANDGWTVAHWAVSGEHFGNPDAPQALQALLDWGAAWDVSNKDGETPLELAQRWSGRCKRSIAILKQHIAKQAPPKKRRKKVR